MTHDQDAISLLACHGITISNTTPLPSTPLSKEIKRLYQDVMGVKYSLFHQRIITQFPKGHIVNTISDMIYDAHTKLHKKRKPYGKILKGYISMVLHYHQYKKNDHQLIICEAKTRKRKSSLK
ncbi:MAG: hypothetical protein ACTJLM_01880 [Ehrlichia sp.]